MSTKGKAGVVKANETQGRATELSFAKEGAQYSDANVKGATTEPSYFIGSLECELETRSKWLWVCNQCEKLIAEENTQIIIMARARLVTVADFIESIRERYVGRQTELTIYASGRSATEADA